MHAWRLRSRYFWIEHRVGSGMALGAAVATGASRGGGDIPADTDDLVAIGEQPSGNVAPNQAVSPDDGYPHTPPSGGLITYPPGLSRRGWTRAMGARSTPLVVAPAAAIVGSGVIAGGAAAVGPGRDPFPPGVTAVSPAVAIVRSEVVAGGTAARRAWRNPFRVGRGDARQAESRRHGNGGGGGKQEPEADVHCDHPEL